MEPLQPPPVPIEARPRSGTVHEPDCPELLKLWTESVLRAANVAAISVLRVV